MNQSDADQVDSSGEPPEDFVRRFLVAFRAWEIEADRIDEEDEAEEERRNGIDDEEPIDDGIDAIRADYQELLRGFATPRIIAQDISSQLGGAHRGRTSRRLNSSAPRRPAAASS